MKELLAAVLSEDENGMFNLAFHLDDQAKLTGRIDKLLLALVHAREAMQPPPETELPKPGSTMAVIQNANWYVQPDLAGNLLVSLYHPALGWVSWQFAQQGAQHFLQTMQSQLVAQQQQGPTQ